MTRRMTLTGFFLAAWIITLSPASPQSRRAITFDDFLGMDRISDAQISPDGKWVVYRVATPDKAANRAPGNLWLAPTGGGEPRQLTRSGGDSHPEWSPDGRRIAFISSRDGTPQVYVIPVDGGEARKLTSLSTGADNVAWSPDGKQLSFTSEVHPDCADDECNRKRDEEREKSQVRARAYDHLLYRHWDTWEDGKRSHLFVVAADGGTPRDLTRGWNYDVPPVQRGGAEDLAWSPDSKEICFVSVTDPVEAVSTNGDLFVVPVAGGTEPKRITSNPGFDAGPVYSPDGRTIAYRAQLRAGFESDTWRLMLYRRDSGAHTQVRESFDRSVDGLVWSREGRALYFAAENHGQRPIYLVTAEAGAEPRLIVDSYNSGLSLSGDGKTLAFLRNSMASPNEIFLAAADGTGVRQLTRLNASRLAALDLPPAEHFWFDGAAGTRVHAMLIRPPGFDPSKKYPVVMIAHGGPQTQFSDAWSYRWNTQMFASPGYAVLCINRRGSTGFGQKFTDEVSNDYGGKAFEDLMLGVDAALKRYPFLDGSRMAAAGASYGGFMMNWFAGHAKGRFKAIVSHAGIYEQVSMYGATEELWFMEWDQQGTPWTNPDGYRKWSPATYAGAFAAGKTPTLVIHGELDYRVPYTQGLQMFTALQKQGVPSRLVVFPDEGHWVLKPQNSELWYREVLGWLARYL